MSRVSRLGCIYNRAVRNYGERSTRVLLFCRTGGLGNCRNLLISEDISWQAHSQEFAMGRLIQRLETTSNDRIPDFDRFSRRSSRFCSPNLGDLQKKRSSKFFSGELQNFNNSKNTVVLELRTGHFSRT